MQLSLVFKYCLKLVWLLLELERFVVYILNFIAYFPRFYRNFYRSPIVNVKIFKSSCKN